MILIRSGFGIAALAAGIVAGFILYRPPSQISRLSGQAYQLASSGNLSQAIAIYSEQIRRQPGEYIFYMRRGLTQKRLGAFDAAVGDFDEALRRIPKPLSAEELGSRLFNAALPETHVSAMAIELHTERADTLRRLGRFDEALSDLDAAVALNGHNSGARYARASLRTLTGHLGDARADFTSILDRGMNMNALFGRGLAAYMSGDWVSAADDLGRVLRLQPHSGNYALWLLKAQLRAHQPIPLDEFKGVPAGSPALPWINAFLGDYDGGSIVAGLRNGAGGDPARACEATHLLGEWFLIKDSPEEAAMAFRAAGETCPQTSVQHVAAAIELHRLEQPAPPVRPVNDRR